MPKRSNAVPNDEPPIGQPFSVDVVKRLAQVMTEHDLSEVDLDTEMGRLRLRRGARVAPQTVPAAAPAVQHAPQAPAVAAAASQSSRSLLEIKSEALGTFYSRPNPDAEPYIKVGSKVTPTTVVGLIEAMKMFNEITAGVSGTVVEILVENQKAVEYGEVLFKVDPQ